MFDSVSLINIPSSGISWLKLKMSNLIQVKLSDFIPKSTTVVYWRELSDSTLTGNLIAVVYAGWTKLEEWQFWMRLASPPLTFCCHSSTIVACPLVAVSTYTVTDVYCLGNICQSMYDVLAGVNLKVPVKIIGFLKMELLRILTWRPFSWCSKSEPNSMTEQIL